MSAVYRAVKEALTEGERLATAAIANLEREFSTEQLLARVSDLLRRGGTEDAEHLVRELERRLKRPTFGKTFDSFSSHVILPAGSYPAYPEYSVDLWTPAASVFFPQSGLFPVDFRAVSARASTAPGGFPEGQMLLLALLRNGVEVGRWPYATWLLDAPFEMEFSMHEWAQLRLGFSEPTVLYSGVSVAFMVNGMRGER